LPRNAFPVGSKAGESDQSVIPKADVKKIQGLLKSKTTKGVKLGLSLLESLRNTADYEAVFTEPVIRAIACTWNAKTLLATAKLLLPHQEVCKRFIAVAADAFCKATEPVRVQLLHDLFKQPLCSCTEPPDPAERCLELDVSSGTVLWDVLHRELLAEKRVAIEYREDEVDGITVCIVNSLNGIHLAGFPRDRGEGRPSGIPHHVLQSSDIESGFPDPRGWIEVAWAVSHHNMVTEVLHRTSENWDPHEWAWDSGEHMIVAMLWSYFNGECLSTKEAAEMGVAKRKSLFQWTEKGSRALAASTNKLLRYRKFIDPHIGSVFKAWPKSPYLPWQNSAASWENEFEARFRKGKKTYASYASLPDELKQLAFYTATAVRDAAHRIKPKTNGEPVIEGLANHTLICLSLHPGTPQSIVKLLAGDKYAPVASAATAGRAAKSDQLSPADKMKDIVDYVVRGTGGRARTDKVSDDTSAIAKRLSRYWSRWKQEDSLNDVDAVNTEEPIANENRMRAVALGVAVARGWIVPTKEGISLMRTSVAELDAPPSDTSNDDDDDD
jgi:hypothetical protein